jgi:D-alanyl-D-alanine carboxypeptidase
MRYVVFIAFLILAGLAAFGFVIHREEATPHAYISSTSPAVRAAQAYLLPVANPGYAPVRDTTVEEPLIDANAALVYHLESGRDLWVKNRNMPVPIASLTKILSAMVVQDLFLPDEIVTVSSVSLRVDGTKQTLYRDEQMRVRDLTSMMLVESSNDAASALAVYASSQGIDFVAQMNAKAETIGMGECVFKDPAGLDDTAYCTADDLLRLVRAALRQTPQLWPILSTKELVVYSADNKIVHTVKSTNELLGQLEGIIGGKTGNTDGALGCMILVVKSGDKGDTLISIVLGSRQRFTDTKILVNWARQAYRWQ